MFHLPTLRRMFEYSDWANGVVLAAAGQLSDEQLDRPIDIGPAPGSLRRILLHTYNGEFVWLQRWQGELPGWPTESAKPSIAELTASFAKVAMEREAFFATLDLTRLEQPAAYRDSRGSMFQALLGDMIVQGLTHSTHHRAQSANAIRRLGGSPPELDYMNHLRKPV